MQDPRRTRPWDRLLSVSPAQRWLVRRTSRKLPVLAYHGVTEPGRFAAQMDELLRQWHPLSAPELMAAVNGQHVLPRCAVLVTFDDGDRTLVDHALPILRDRGIPAIAFVIASLIGTARAPWWVEVAAIVDRQPIPAGSRAQHRERLLGTLKRMPDDERVRAIDELRSADSGRSVAMQQLTQQDLVVLEAAGITIGNHTLNHPCLDRCTSAGIIEELEGAHAKLSRWLGRPPDVFAYPNGNHDARAAAWLAAHEYQLAFLFDHRVASLPIRDRLRISRVRVNAAASRARFRILLSGLHSALHHGIGRA